MLCTHDKHVVSDNKQYKPEEGVKSTINETMKIIRQKSNEQRLVSRSEMYSLSTNNANMSQIIACNHKQLTEQR